MNEAVKTGTEGTVPAESLPAETQTAEEPTTEATSPSGQDVNTQEQGVAEAEQAEKPLSPKAQERFQKLANQNRALMQQQEQKQLQTTESRLQQISTLPPMPGQQYIDPVQANLWVTQQKQRLLEEKITFQELEREFPEMDAKSEKFLPEFDKRVYNAYKNGEDPKEVAFELRKLMKLSESKGLAATERATTEKQVNSAAPQKRTAGTDLGNSEAEARYNNFRKSGKVDDLAALVNW